MTADQALILAKGFHGEFKSPIVQLSEVVNLHYGKALAAPTRRPGEIRVYGSNGQCGWHDTPLRQGPTVVLGRKGQGPLGVKWCPWPFWVIDTAYYVTVDPQRIDLRYFYYLTGYIGLNHLKDGTSNPSLSRDVFGRQAVPLPDLPTQRKIAGILSAYDDLIENNLRRIKILEEMAQSLYREWFVHFRFPGHESAKFKDSELGKIPIGWILTDLAAVCVKDKGIQTGPFGSQLHESDYSDEGVPVVMPKDLIGFRIRTDTIARIPEETADKLIRHRMKLGDIVYGRRGDIGRRAFIMPHQVGWFCGTGCLRIRSDPDAVNGWYLFNFLGQDNVASLIAGRAQGVTMPNLNTGILSSVPVTLPPKSIQEHFANLSFPFAQAREALQSQIQNLRRTRDILLPQLLSS